MMIGYSGKVVWITGASSGIGEALAYEVARSGALVAISARRMDRLEQVAQRIDPTGGRVLALAVDVTDEEALREGVRKIVARFGRLDIAVANAGFGVAAPFEELTLDDYRRQFDTNVYGVLRTAWASLQELRNTRGLFVIMGSVTSFVSTSGGTPYAMSKFAVRAFADGLRAELAADGVDVTLICPGFVESEIRQVDNHGRLKDGAVDRIDKRLVMPVGRAAHQIAEAIHRRKPEVVITGHGKLGVFIARHCPALLRFLLTGIRRDADKRFHFGRPKKSRART